MSDPKDTQPRAAENAGGAPNDGFQPSDDVLVEGTTLDGDAIPADGHTPSEQAKPKGANLQDLVDEPAKVMRIGTMIRQLLEEVKAAPLDDAARPEGIRPHARVRAVDQGPRREPGPLQRLPRRRADLGHLARRGR